jgi:hypothetical protein
MQQVIDAGTDRVIRISLAIYAHRRLHATLG